MPESFAGTKIPVMSAADIVTARRVARDLCERLGLGKADQTRLATAVSELARNVIQYACEGVCLIEDRSDSHTRRIRVQVEDRGPGIPDIPLAMTDGYSTSGGLGAGLPGTRRLVDEFQIESEPGHTRITIILRKPL
ncbi:anti-sigma regulatory factor [Imhoffiella purpurea]|uniref:Anti-sigma B factor RsbT n=1 Tax=Imhoffiella purpurea TaxID=1249627 RepID=W9VU82_9GAMM|nr:anti-sigma regulatory factor [Imhoffiella purpurea]EXJ13915.1 anti-sigma B factor RsbT [Imhoffiella purpurea]